VSAGDVSMQFFFHSRDEIQTIVSFHRLTVGENVIGGIGFLGSADAGARRIDGCLFC